MQYTDLIARIASISPLWHRSYELPCTAYYLVINPYEEVYKKEINFFQSKRFLDSVQKYIKGKFDPIYYVITREINATRIHINVYMVCPRPITLKVGSVNHRYGLWFRVIDTFHETRSDILKYMFKENKTRPFEQYLDYHQSLITQADLDVREESDEYIDLYNFM